MIEPLVTTATLLGGGFAVTAVGLVRQTRAKRALASRLGPLESEHFTAQQVTSALHEESKHLAETRMPALVNAAARGQRGVTVPGLSVGYLAGTPIDGYHRAVLGLCDEAISITRDRIGLAARSSVRDIIDEAQTYLVRCQMKAVEEMDRYPEGTAYHQSLMDLDHLVTRALHTLQRTRILTGSWPGLQRADCTFREIVESARGRIDALLRVNYTYEPGTGEVWVEGRVVEPITVALTELLSNATAYSDGKVSVEVQQIQTGYCIVVDDAGLNMNVYQRQEAAQLLTQRTVLDVTSLPDTQHLGFPVIGRLASEYGFNADVSSTSPFGGVRAVLRVPRDLLGHGPTDEEREAERQAAAASVVSQPLIPEQQLSPDGFGNSSDDSDSPGLPQRRRRSPRHASTALPRASEPAPPEDPDAFLEGFANLTAAIREGENDQTEGEQPRD
ncbi:histidine kinase [Streptomyces sp. NBC_00582]|uniref:histidine kinase n=1 Tax=Streptomyces sp. NBC_00582 TaxID=2975783 RepID=UPI002E7FD105|nr:histidine kinase [Streptomyces sp. NBC_00582]WUB68438.1 histidine kinase [Streptomyces sp. NBC_00582]